MGRYIYRTECSKGSKLLFRKEYKSLKSQLCNVEDVARSLYDELEFPLGDIREVVSSYQKALRSRNCSKREYSYSYSYRFNIDDIGKSFTLIRFGVEN